VSHLLFAVIADGGPHNNGPDFGKASPLGLLVVVLLLIATLLLLRSMNRQLKKVPESFDPQHPEPDQAADEGTDTVTEPPEQSNGSTKPPGPADEPG
jgi:hypothetical protein